MVDLQKCTKYMNIFLGIVTGLVGILLLIFLIWKVLFKFSMLPLFLLPFFLVMFGMMVLSNEREIGWIKQNCQFLNHRIGIVFFYAYLAAMMGQLSAIFEPLGTIPQIAAIACSVGYLVLTVLFALVGCFGQESVNAKAQAISDKITADD